MGSSHNLVLYGRTGSGESPIGDVMVLLSIIIVFISSLYLGEGDNRRNGYAYLYFFFFVIVTIALVCSRSLLQLLLCFEVLFLPSLYFVHKYGYSSQVESSILFLFGWTVVGSAICLCTVIYLYGLTGSLEFDFIVKYKFTNSEKAVIGVLFFIGFGIKLPLLPFYF
jgi:formate hydrogenlyase subunit 3/multisubunit Na+/H+ antiporter MnhD subunit